MDEVISLKFKHVEKAIQKHDNAIKEQEKTLNKITQLLAQIRWMCLGGIGYFILDNVGLLAVVKKVFGV